jgi:hypothetical protein
MRAPIGARFKEQTMVRIMRGLVGAVALTFAIVACSSSDDGKGSSSSSSSSGSSGQTSSGGSSGSSGGGSSGSSGTTETQQTCTTKWNCLNGSCKCTDGSNKGKSCCAPDPDEGKTCDKGTDCDSVCQVCS